MSENRKKALEVKHLKQYFMSGHGKNKLVVKAVDDISFDIYEGEVFGLVGESGCGKTTTGRTIIKLYEATDGEVFFKGQRIGAGLMSAKNKIKEIKQKAKVDILNATPAKLGVVEIKETYAADVNIAKYNFGRTLHSLDRTSSVYKKQVEDAKLAQSKAIAAAKEKRDSALANHKHNVASNPSTYKVDQNKILEIKENTKKLISEQKELIKHMKADNAFKGATYDTMKKIQMIFQDPISSLNPRMTVREIIAEGLRINGVKDKDEITERVYESLKLVGLVPEHAFRYPHEFSGGQRQRIGIARALIVKPELLIADEPISALDVSIQAQVINLLKELREELGLTILFIAHDLSVVKYFSDRIAVMYFGRIVEMADADTLFKHPLHPYTKSLLSAIPQPDPHSEKTRKRFDYVPQRDHQYTADNMPTFQEIENGHFILANDEEIEKYKAEYKI